MKINTLIRAVAFGAALSATSAFANAVYVERTSFNGVPDGSGGEFKDTFNKGKANQYSILTFCLEEFVTINTPAGYSYTIDDRALAGGKDLHDPVGAGPAGDPLSKATAWLYEQFAKGTLVDSDGVGSYWTAANHDKNAGILQKAIWTFEDEFDWSKNNFYYDLAVAHFGSKDVAFSTYTGTTVKVLNIWGKNGKDIQSHLIYVPDSGMTVGLLGLGLLSLAAFRRKSKAA